MKNGFFLVAPIASVVVLVSKSEAADAVMVPIPAGRVPSDAKGTPDGGREASAGELVPAFSIDRTEVTAEQYAACVSAKVCEPIDAKSRRCNVNRGRAYRSHPANCVTWGQADAYCRWRGARLPTSKQWERAARGDDRRKYPWGDDQPGKQLCWDHEPGGSSSTCPVGTHLNGASSFGVLDLAGNVTEWTATESPHAFDKQYLIRGGGFAVDPLAMADPDELPYRLDQTTPRSATDGALDLGFRCAKDAGAQAVTAPAAAAASNTAAVSAYVPTPGTPVRKEIMDALRSALKTRSEFRVLHLRAAGDWAYFEGREHGLGDSSGPLLRASLRRAADGHWQVVNTCAAPEGSAELAAFRKELADLPQTVLPPPAR